MIAHSPAIDAPIAEITIFVDLFIRPDSDGQA
jgi:hypothetical protein